MSRQREVTWRRSDEEIATAFEVALAQLGVRFPAKHLPYLTINGNKSDGPVEVKTYGNTAMVYIHGKDEIFFYVEKIVFSMLDKMVLNKPITVIVHNFDGKKVGNHLVTALTQHTEHRREVLYLMLGTVYGFDIASSLLCYLWKYPKIEMDEDQFKLTYELDDICGVWKIELWYSRRDGYTQAIINQKKVVVCHQFKNTWTVVE